MRYDVLETNADGLISDAVRAASKADIAVSNGFRFGLPVLAGAVTEADLWNLLPMDARIKVGWLTGQGAQGVPGGRVGAGVRQGGLQALGRLGPTGGGADHELQGLCPQGPAPGVGEGERPGGRG